MSNLANLIDLKSYAMNGIDLNNPDNFGEDGFIKDKLHQLVILGGTFPFSGYVSDLYKMQELLFTKLCIVDGYSHETYSIFTTLVQKSRAELSLKIKMHVKSGGNGVPLSQLAGVGAGDHTFTQHSLPIMTRVSSATRRGVITIDSFEGKYFLYVQGRYPNSSTFYLNYEKLNALGSELGLLAWNSVEHNKKGKKTQFAEAL